MYKLLIVDDEPLIRRGIRSLADLSSIEISRVLEAKDGEEAVQCVREERPDIVLMDINMPKQDGLTTAAMIKEEFPEIYVLILTGYDYFEYAQVAIRSKVDDYLLKPISKAEIELSLRKTVDLLKKRARQREYGDLRKVEEELIRTEGDDPDSTDKIKDYMKDHLYDKELSLAKVAEDIGFNSSYLSTMIKKIYGLPFQDYVNKKRMEKAKILLLSTSMKNYEIAEKIGMEDVNYFVTKFKKTWGVTPKQYRQGAK